MGVVISYSQACTHRDLTQNHSIEISSLHELRGWVYIERHGTGGPPYEYGGFDGCCRCRCTTMRRDVEEESHLHEFGGLAYGIYKRVAGYILRGKVQGGHLHEFGGLHGGVVVVVLAARRGCACREGWEGGSRLRVG